MRTRRPRLDVRLVLTEAGRGLRRHVGMTLAVVLTVAVSLGLLGAALLVSRQVETLKGYWYDKVEVSVFLCASSSDPAACPHPVTAAERVRIRATLTALPVTEHVFHESSAQAYARFAEQYRGSAVAAQVDPSSLPESFRVKLVDPTRFGDVAGAVGPLPGVESVTDQRALLERFFAVVSGLQTAALAIALVQVVVAALLVASTVRTAVFVRRKEVAIMRLVGAPASMVRAPFLAESALAGLAGAALACGALAAGKAILVGRLAESASYLRYITWGDYWAVVPVLLAAGVVLAAGAAAGALRRHLRV